MARRAEKHHKDSSAAKVGSVGLGVLAALTSTGAMVTWPLVALTSLVLTAGLISGSPAPIQASTDIPEVEHVESVPVSEVQPTAFSVGEVAEAARVPLPGVKWPEIGQRFEVELTRDWSGVGPAGAQVRAAEATPAGTRLRVELAGRGEGADGLPVGLLFDVRTLRPALISGEDDAEPGGELEAEPLEPEPSPAPEPEPSASPEPEPSVDPEADYAGGFEPVAHRLLGGPGATDEVEWVEAEPVDFEIRVDYSDFAGAYGADWAGRLRLFAVAECAASERMACEATPVPLDSTNHIGEAHLTAVLDADLFGPSGGFIALMADPAGDGGDYSATSLSLASSWSAGGQGGDFTWSYPISTPAGVNGPEPQLAIGYSSGAVDGLTASTNAQPSWIGEGFGFDVGFIERRYRACYEDQGGTHNVPRGYLGGDLCWHEDNLSISFDGRSSPLVRIGSTDTWRMKYDDGTRIQRFTRSPAHGQFNGAHEGEYWVVTTPDGTQAYFGLHKRSTTDATPTNSVSTVPVFGNHAGEPCYAASFASAHCDQGWRWGLDYVVDANGNSMTFFYDQETNRYGLNENASSVAYDRSAVLKRIEYGTRTGSDTTGNAPARVIFDTSQRCIPSGTVTCASLTSGTAQHWPDVPFDQICTSTTTCANRYSPTFFSRLRLTEVTTQVWNPATSSYQAVDSWALEHSFPDSGDHNPRSLWLTKITHTGHDGTNISMPPVEFGGTQMANRVDTIGDSMSAYYKWRVNAINNGVGGHISVTYSAQDCTTSNKPSPTGLDTNTRRCFPTYYQPSHADTPLLEFFHKYVVTQVVETDGTTGSLSSDVVTSYEYVGGGAWRYDSSGIPRDVHRTWNEWRGYASVVTRVGEAPQERTWERTWYLRGMHGNRTHAGGSQTVDIAVPGGTTIRDYDHFGGFAVRTETRLGEAGEAIQLGFAIPWRSAATASGGGHEARIVAPAIQENRTRITGGSWRTTKATTTYDAHGLPIQIFDEGDLADSNDDQCTEISYAKNTSAWMLDYPSQIITTTGNCATNPSSAEDVISAQRIFYDGGGLHTAPSAGNVTRLDTAANWASGAIVYQSDALIDYDAYGRVIETTDAANETTEIEYSPATGIPTQVTETNPLGHVTTSTVNRSRSQATQVVGPDGGVTDLEYDALGRLTSVWFPNRTKTSGGSATLRFSYEIDGTNPNVVKTEHLYADNIFLGPSYRASFEIYDGLLRERSTQTLAHNPGGGRLITETIYDTRGWVTSERGPYYNSDPPSGTLVNAAPSTMPHYVNYVYDGVGRVVTETLMSHSFPQWATTYAYSGDRIAVTPPDGGTATATITDAHGRTTQVHQYLGATPSGPSEVTNYTYTPAGQLASITNHVGTIWEYAYDMRGNRISADDPDSGLTTTEHDVLDRPISTTDAENRTLHTAYDALGRRTELRDDGPTGDLRASWIYDTLRVGQLTSATRHAAVGDFVTSVTAYDALARPTATRLMVPESLDEFYRPVGYIQTYAYNVDGTLQSHGLPNATGMANELLQYGYTPTGLLNHFGGSGAFISQTDYDAYGRILQRRRGHVVGDPFYEMREYEVGTGRLTRQHVTITGITDPVADYRHTYSDAGDITMTRDLNASGTTADTQCYAYDHARRLTEAYTASATDCETAPTTSNLGAIDPYWHSYTYSPSGNRLQWTERFRTASTIETRIHDYDYPAPTNAQPHALQEVTTTGYQPGVESFDYDDSGVLIERDRGSGEGLDLHYDAEQRLIAATDKDTADVTEFIYDANGVRLLKIDEATDTTTLYIGGAEYARDDTTGAITPTRHYSLDGEAIAIRTGTTTNLRHIVADTQGTGTVQIDPVTKTYEKRRYAPFGFERNDEDPPDWHGDRGFLNKTHDESLGTTHLDAREYDPRLGRFTTPDPLLAPYEPQHLNPYAYGLNNPLTYTDPDGLLPCSWASWCRDAHREVVTRTAPIVAQGAESAAAVFQEFKDDPLQAYINYSSGFGMSLAETADHLAPPYIQALRRKHPEQNLSHLLGSAYDSLGIDQKSGAFTFGGYVGFTAQLAIPGGAGIKGGIKVAQVGRVIIAGRTAAKAGDDFTRVGRWMSNDELVKMQRTGLVQEGSGGRTFVTNPANPAAFPAGKGVFVEFNVPTRSLFPAGRKEWSVIPGPNVGTLRFGSPPGQMPPATCIMVVCRR